MPAAARRAPAPLHPAHVGRQGHAAVDAGVALAAGVHAARAVELGQLLLQLPAALRAVELGVEEGHQQRVVGVACGAEALGAGQRLHVADVGGDPAAAAGGGGTEGKGGE